jgi:hypothetical protein
MTEVIIFLGVCLVLLLLAVKGVIKTFKRQPVVAILCVIFLRSRIFFDLACLCFASFSQSLKKQIQQRAKRKM